MNYNFPEQGSEVTPVEIVERGLGKSTVKYMTQSNMCQDLEILTKDQLLEDLEHLGNHLIKSIEEAEFQTERGREYCFAWEYAIKVAKDRHYRPLLECIQLEVLQRKIMASTFYSNEAKIEENTLSNLYAIAKDMLGGRE